MNKILIKEIQEQLAWYKKYLRRSPYKNIIKQAGNDLTNAHRADSCIRVLNQLLSIYEMDN